MTILAIDPGPEKSAYVILEQIYGGPSYSGPPGKFQLGELIHNADMRDFLRTQSLRRDIRLAIEMVACFGMAVGAEVFDTCRWIGRFEERWGGHVQRVYRKDVKIHLCNSMKAKDANIRQALIDKYGPVGTKKNPGPLRGVSGHLWAALAVADYAATHSDL